MRVTPWRRAASLLHRGSDRLLDQNIDAAGNAFKRKIMMQVSGCRDGDRIDTGSQQLIEVGECGAAERPRDKIALLAVGIGDASQLNARHVRQDARMVAAHHADAHHPDLQRTDCAHPHSLDHGRETPPHHFTRLVP
jgi:hypothetical protein